MCPCFSYRLKDYKYVPDKDEPSNWEKATVIAMEGNKRHEEKYDFCCCYYKHLPGCNVVYRIANKGGYFRGTRRWSGLWTEYGEQKGTGGTALRLSGDPAGDSEEYSHAAYNMGEHGAKLAKKLITRPQDIHDKTGIGSGHGELPTSSAAREFGKAIIDLVMDKFDCRSVLGVDHSDRQQAQRSWDLGQQLLKNVDAETNLEKEVPRYVPKKPVP